MVKNDARASIGAREELPIVRIEAKIREIDLTISAVKKREDKMVTVNKEVLLEYISMARKYAELRLKEEKSK